MYTDREIERINKEYVIYINFCKEFEMKYLYDMKKDTTMSSYTIFMRDLEFYKKMNEQDCWTNPLIQKELMQCVFFDKLNYYPDDSVFLVFFKNGLQKEFFE